MSYCAWGGVNFDNYRLQYYSRWKKAVLLKDWPLSFLYMYYFLMEYRRYNFLSFLLALLSFTSHGQNVSATTTKRPFSSQWIFYSSNIHFLFPFVLCKMHYVLCKRKHLYNVGNSSKTHDFLCLIFHPSQNTVNLVIILTLRPFVHVLLKLLFLHCLTCMQSKWSVQCIHRKT
jgi:hypothetical protein